MKKLTWVAPWPAMVCGAMLSCGAVESDGAGDGDTDADTDTEVNTDSETAECVPSMTDIGFVLRSVGEMEFAAGRRYELAEGVFAVSDWGVPLCEAELDPGQIEGLMDAAVAAVPGSLAESYAQGCVVDGFVEYLDLTLPPCHFETSWCHLEDIPAALAELVDLIVSTGDGLAADCPTDTDSDTDFESSLADCDGGKLDPATDLCWQDPPSGEIMDWVSAISHCDGLVFGGHSDWRLPRIDDLISLLRGCQDGAATGDLSPSTCEMTPAGCTATDTCDGSSGCWYCTHLSGPGAGGCYQDPSLGGTCSTSWSSSTVVSSAVYAWSIMFSGGGVVLSPKQNSTFARCVRSP
jgi:hypothetical protein